MNVEVVRSRGAAEDTAEIGGDLSRFSEAPFPKVGRIGPASPLRLTGPRVHELVISAPGRQRKTVRILVSPNAGEARATVKAELKD
jgi:hypothetical protein